MFQLEVSPSLIIVILIAVVLFLFYRLQNVLASGTDNLVNVGSDAVSGLAGVYCKTPGHLRVQITTKGAGLELLNLTGSGNRILI